MIYVQLYLLFGMLYTFIFYDKAKDYYKRNVRQHPMAKGLSDYDIERIISYCPLWLIITWPLSLIALILNLINNTLNEN